MMKQAIVLLSGGLDSAVAMRYERLLNFDSVTGFHVDYGQRNALAESIAGRAVARACDCEFVEFVLRWPDTMSALVSSSMDIAAKNVHGQPGDFLPFRNLALLTTAAMYGVPRGITEYIVGGCKDDISPDASIDFLDAADSVLNASVKERIRIHAPLLSRSKVDLIRLGARMGAPLSKTLSCYTPLETDEPCAMCRACAVRAKAFKDAELRDPALAL